ncbi:hypothetical protein MKY07_15525 [Solibacillus sp. FSL W7-1472]|uniref:hypothetical protein n=1 Tax=Solibacillus sp. FSL W7-1472 TaxID=2921707 RepID=UPI0007FB20CE|nr:hypothetical protein [Solibacillus silvestris]OBW57104.1 hypothetical protein A9986_10190 [Solibacillus silvestris]
MKKLFAAFMMLGVIFIMNDAQAQQNNTKSTWLWHTHTITDEQTIQFLIEKEVTTVYLQINPELSNDVYAAFINRMREANIEVQALDGGPYWNTANFDALWAWISQYHQEYPASKFKAVHLDVEPYLSALWEQNRNLAVSQYQELIQHALYKVRCTELRLETDIPFWYDEVLYYNQFGEGNLAEWMIANTDGVSIMAYRNTVAALKSITKNEMSYAKKYQTPVVMGVETMPFPYEPYITFADEGEIKMNQVLDQVASHYAKNRYYSGVGIHYVQSWQGLRE